MAKFGVPEIRSASDYKPTSEAEEPATADDLILGGTIVRIARIPRPMSFMLWSKASLASRLYNRIARQNATETHVGFIADKEINHLNIEADTFRPVAKGGTVIQHELTDESMFVITESTYWWAELKLEQNFHFDRLSFAKCVHELPGGTTYVLLSPSYEGLPLKFKCPSQPQYPEVRTDMTRLLEHEWQSLKQLEPCTEELEPIFSDPLSPTAKFRRALTALIAELAAHGILAEDDHLAHYSGRQSVADMTPTINFFSLNSLSADADIPCLQLDSITECFDHSVTLDATEVQWNDDYEYVCRTGSPEIELSQEQTGSAIHYTAGTEEAMRGAMFTCQRLAPQFGLVVEFDGDVTRAATISPA